MELDRHDRWLLEMVVEMKYPLELLASADLHLHLNRPGHGLPVEQIAARIHRLQREGLIELYERGDIGGVLAVQTPAELVAFFEWSLPRKDWDRYFGLTTQGGAAWEQLAHPDWSRYVDFGTTEDEVEINALDRDRIELVLTTVLGEPHVNRAAEVWTSRVPWQATYWKMLPSGVGYRAPLGNDSEREGVWPDWLYHWFDRVELPRA